MPPGRNKKPWGIIKQSILSALWSLGRYVDILSKRYSHTPTLQSYCFIALWGGALERCRISHQSCQQRLKQSSLVMCPLQGLLFSLTLLTLVPSLPQPTLQDSFTNLWGQCCFSSWCPLKFDSILPNRGHQTLGIIYCLTLFILLSGTTGCKCGWWVSILTAPWHVMPGWQFLKIIKLRKDTALKACLRPQPCDPPPLSFHPFFLLSPSCSMLFLNILSDSFYCKVSQNAGMLKGNWV